MRYGATPALARAVLLAAGLGMIGVLTGTPAAVVVAVPFLAYVAWAMITRPVSPTVVVRAAPTSVAIQEGDAVEIRVVAEHPDGASAAGTLIANWPAVPGVRFDPADGALVDSGDLAEGVAVTVEPRRWGRYLVGPAQVAVTDSARAWRAAGRATPASIIVRPVSQPLEGASGVARPIGVAGLHTSTAKGDGSALADIREFRLGDRLRRVNWRVTSRTRTLHVNETHTDRDTEVLLVTDSTHDVPGIRPEDATSLDATVRAVAGIAQHYIGFGDRVALHDLGRRVRSLRAGTGRRQVALINDALSRIDRAASPGLPAKPLPRIASGTLVFFCSPLLDPGALAELVRLRRLGGEVIAVDTLPESIGTVASLAKPERHSFLVEAWVVRRLERELSLRRLADLGIPVVPWRGTASLGGVLLAMAAARQAPRMAVGR
ncbi:MAG TPA: DUF58 domain-containing protein [Propionibacteriaceae bacterium]|nr:DUF58 domain-containing protein [Propionibacteriaceae bacterium]